MKKKLLVALALAAVVLGGCGNSGEKSKYDVTTESAEELQDTEKSKEALAETEYIDGFERADYDKFNSYAYENGLEYTPIYIEGKVLNQTKIDGDSDLSTIHLVVEQQDGNRWVASLISDSEIYGIENKSVRIFGEYTGFSDVFNLPAMAVGSQIEADYNKARIEEEKNGEYIEIWNFYDDCLKEELENSNDIDDSEGEIQDDFLPTIGQSNALKSAKEYLDIMAFSYTGLIHQLEEGDGYTHEEAVYAADNCGTDWNEQAAKSAKEYLDIMPFSREELIEQLVNGDGFTHEQAVYGVEQNGY